MHHSGVDVAHGLVLLFGLGARALPSWDSRTRRNNLSVGLAIRVMVGPSGHAISPHPSSRKGHHSTVTLLEEIAAVTGQADREHDQKIKALEEHMALLERVTRLEQAVSEMRSANATNRADQAVVSFGRSKSAA